MFDVVVKTVSAVTSGLGFYRKLKDSSRRRAFASALMALHLRLVEIASDGHRILAHLAYFLERFGVNATASQKSWEGTVADFNDLLRRQSVNLQRLDEALYPLAVEMEFFFPGIDDALRDILPMKANGLQEIARRLPNGEIPTAAFRESIRPMWDQQHYKNVQSHLETGRFQSDIAELERFSQEIREFVSREFSVEEILAVTESAGQDHPVRPRFLVR